MNSTWIINDREFKFTKFLKTQRNKDGESEGEEKTLMIENLKTVSLMINEVREGSQAYAK